MSVQMLLLTLLGVVAGLSWYAVSKINANRDAIDRIDNLRGVRFFDANEGYLADRAAKERINSHYYSIWGKPRWP